MKLYKVLNLVTNEIIDLKGGVEFRNFCLKNSLHDTDLYKTRKNLTDYKGFRLIDKYKESDIEVLSSIDIHNLVDAMIDTTYEDKNVYKALLYSDFHYPFINENLSNVFFQFITENKDMFDEVVDLGDGTDAGALGNHLQLEDNKMELYKEIEGYSAITNKIKSILNCKMVVLADNHFDNRIKRYLAQNPALKGLIREIDFGYDYKIPHGKPYFPLHEYGQDKIAGIHGIPTNDFFTKNLTIDYNHDVFCGHLHTIQTYHNKNSKTAYGLPAMCKDDMAYLFNRATRWRFGFSILSWYPKENRYVLEVLE